MRRFRGWVVVASLLVAGTGRTDPVQDAQRAMASGEHALAASTLSRSSDVEALLLRGRALFLAKRYRDAEAAYRKAVRLAPARSPWRRKARFGLAECHAVQRRFQEAERLFSAELAELSAPARREKIARRYVLLGDEHADPPADRDSPDPARAERFYRAALEVGIEGALLEEVHVKIGRALLEQKRHPDAASHLARFLADHPEADRGSEVAYLAGLAYHRAGQQDKARRFLREVLLRHARSPFAPKAAFLTSRTFGMPKPGDRLSMLRGQEALRRYVKDYPQAEKVRQARLETAMVAMALNHHAQAEDDLRAYVSAAGPEENLAIVRFNLGVCLAAQARFDEAVTSWKGYLQKHPTHGSWLEARKGIQDMAIQKADAAMQKKAWAKAASLYAAFAETYPATERTPLALLMAARALAEMKRTDDALSTLKTLTGKFPKTIQACEGWYRTGLLLEEVKADFAGAREAYKKAAKMEANSGARTDAQVRLAELDEASLVVAAPKTFRSGQKPEVTWHVRNLKNVEVRLFKMEAEDFFRDQRRMEHITEVDIALCTPDRTWTVPVEGYKKHKRIEQRVPLPADRPGLYVVHLTAGDLEATTAVLVTDLGVILKTVPGEVFTFAQDLKRNRPFAGARVVVADDERVLAEGKTGRDGVYRVSIDEEDVSGEIRILALRDGNLSWTNLSYPGGQPETAAAPRAFLFSDRPAYRPGDEVGLAGIVRHRWMKAGFLSFEAGKSCTLKVLAPGGQLVEQLGVQLDAFGVFHARVKLDPAARPGNYAFELAAGKEGRFHGSFRVQEFRRLPFDISVKFDRPVVFQGEPLRGTIRVRRHHGAPAPDQDVHYRIDGESEWKSGTTGPAGELGFEIDTLGMEETRRVLLRVRLPKHNLVQEAHALVAVQAYQVALAVPQKTLFAGQPFDLTVSASGPDGRPVGAKLTLQAIHRLPGNSGEVRGLSKQLTVPEGGELRVPISLKEGGLHFLRVTGSDRAGHPITAELAVHLVGEEAPGIFLDLDGLVQTLGSPAKARIVSRLDRALVLLTYETDRILRHRTVEVKKGDNPVSLALSEELAPNFVLAAGAMHADKLHTAAREVTIKRLLDIEVRPDRAAYRPGDEVSLTLVARSADGKPVDARLIVSVVDEALFRQFPENLPDLFATFHRRHSTGDVLTSSSNTFGFPEVAAELIERAEVQETEGSAAMAALSSRRKAITEEATERFAGLSQVGIGGGGGGVGSAYGVGGLGARGYGRGGGGRASIRAGKAQLMGVAPLRRFFEETAAFLPEVRTGPDGVANVTFRLPDTITTWRVTTRGVTRDTQVGEDRTKLTASRSFWAELVVPPELEEGDQVQPLARVFNETGAGLDVRLALGAPGVKETVRNVRVEPGGTADALFPAVTVPEAAAGKVVLGLTASAGELADRLERKIPVRPRGIRERVLASGQVDQSVTRTLKLDPAWQDPALTIRLDARMTHLFFAGRLDPLLFGDRPEEALVALNILDLLGPRAEPAMRDLVVARLKRSLVRLMAVQHDDGGWGWYRGQGSNLQVTAAAVRALARVRPLTGKIGWSFPQAGFDRAVGFLKSGLTGLPAEDWMGRAAVLHALAHLGKEQVPFVQLHRLHRLRANLPLGAGAQLGHTWLLLGRPEKAAEVATTIRPEINLRPPGGKRPGWLVFWGQQPADVARALALLGAVRPADPLLKQGAAWLLDRGEALGFYFPREAEAVSEALGIMLKARKREERFRVRVVVNGKQAADVDVRGGLTESVREVSVDPGLLKAGDNQLRMEITGTGQCFFVATLSGYRRDAPKPPVDAPVRIKRIVEPVPLPYRGHEIHAGFSVVEPGSPRWINAIDRIPTGRRVRVTLEVTKTFPEPLDHCVLTERIPPGLSLVEGTVRGHRTHSMQVGRRLAMFLASTGSKTRIRYELVAINPGTYHFPPAALVSLANPGTRALGPATGFVVDDPSKPVSEIRPTPDELYQTGMAAAEHDPKLVVELLERLNEEHQLRENVTQEVLGKLLMAAIELGDHGRTVKYFELAKEKNPGLVIPFDKVGRVQEAYRSQKLHEGGLHLARGLAQARFLAEIRAVGVLESEGEMAEALSLLRELIRSFPDNGLTAEAAYAFSQVIFKNADGVAEGEEVTGFDRPGLLDEVIALMAFYLGRFPGHPDAPPAIYSLASALLERGRPERAVQWCQAGLSAHAESDLAPAIAYLKAFSHFKQGDYGKSLELCRQVEKDAEDDESREMARYIMAQIHHARGTMDRALHYYRLVQDRFRDAHETLEESRRVLLAVPEVLEVPPGERPVLDMEVRNIDRVGLRAYRVDPMKLYLLKGSLEDLTDINLAGIKPVFTRDLRLKRRPGVTRTEKVRLRVPGQGAYLLLARGGNRLAHTLVLAGALSTDVTELSGEGRVRVTVRNGRGRTVPGARVQLKGSHNDRFTAGKTDLRGIFIAEAIQGAVTVIAQHKKAYGLYRGSQELTDDGSGADEPIYEKKTVYEFDEDNIEGELTRPDGEMLQQRRQNAADFFNQDVKGMTVEQAK